MARNRFPARRTAPGLKQWTSTVPQSDISVLAAASAVIDSFFVTSGAAPETVLRTRGLFTIQTDQVSATETPFGALGLCVVSDQALAAGVASVPTPYTDADSDLWFYHQYFAAPVLFGTTTGIRRLDQQYEIDSKAMRRLSEDESIILVVENASAADGLRYIVDLRILSKLS